MYKIGDMIQFKYSRGTYPDKLRQCYVYDASSAEISCWDFELEDFRRFKTAYISQSSMMPENRYSIVKLGNLPSTINSADIISGFKKEGKVCLFLAQDNIIISFTPEIDVKNQIITSPLKNHIQIRGNSNQMLYLCITSNGQVEIACPGGKYEKATNARLIEGLKYIGIL